MAHKISMRRARQVGKQLGIDFTQTSLWQFRRGLEVELEHRNVTHGKYSATGKIALAHLKEYPDYYTRLRKVEE